jgi:hypothetical protein
LAFIFADSAAPGAGFLDPKTRRKKPGRSFVLGAGWLAETLVEMLADIVVVAVGSWGGKAGLL